jgi:hypothetical protein
MPERKNLIEVHRTTGLSIDHGDIKGRLVHRSVCEAICVPLASRPRKLNVTDTRVHRRASRRLCPGRRASALPWPRTTTLLAMFRLVCVLLGDRFASSPFLMVASSSPLSTLGASVSASHYCNTCI